MVSGYLKKNWIFPASALLVLSYFCYFTLPSLNGRFRNDDAYNIYYYWSRGFWPLIQNIFLFFSTYYRPMGGVYYYPIYELFGLNPLPYHVVTLIVLFINIILVYRCATLLSGSKIIAGLCSVLMAYHAEMILLFYAPAFIFDVLCFTFFFGAFLYYLRIRCTDRELGLGQLLIFLLLYIAALESKEMAVSLPAMILAYEMLWHPPAFSPSSISKWLRTTGLPILISALLTGFFLVGKSIGADPLSNNPMYQTTINFRTFIESNVRFARQIFYLRPEGWFNGYWLIGLWVLLGYIAISRRRKHLEFSLVMTIVAPLPIAFIPDRGGAMLYIPCFGWALVVATLIESICSFLSREPLFRRVNVSLAKALPLLLAVVWIWHLTDIQNKKQLHGLQFVGREFWSVKEQLAALLPKVEPDSQVIFYNDIFPGFDLKYIAKLVYRDRSIAVLLGSKYPLSRSHLEKADYVLAFDKEKLVILKRPGEPFR